MLSVSIQWSLRENCHYVQLELLAVKKCYRQGNKSEVDASEEHIVCLRTSNPNYMILFITFANWRQILLCSNFFHLVDTLCRLHHYHECVYSLFKQFSNLSTKIAIFLLNKHMLAPTASLLEDFWFLKSF